jgi:hypothetical protein
MANTDFEASVIWGSSITTVSCEICSCGNEIDSIISVVLSSLDNVASDVLNVGDVISEQQQQMNCECGRGKKMSIIDLSSAAERTQIIDWLSPINFFSRQADISRARLAGTGGWLLDHPSFQEWKSGSGKTLWCRGMRA